MPSVQVCETVTGASMATLIAARDAAGDADLVELRLDGVGQVDVPAALAGRAGPAIVTCRAAWEGGRFTGDEPARLAVLAEAAEAGAEYVDVEWRAEAPAVQGTGARLVLSHHDFDRMPDDVADRIRAMEDRAPDVLKVAVMARQLADCALLREAARGSGARVVIAMGPAGALSRVCPWLFDSCWMYAGQAAPGQFTRRELVEDYRVRETTSRTQIFGVAGPWREARRLSAAHNHWWRARAIDAVSVPLVTADAADLRAVAEAFDIRGVSTAATVLDAHALREQARRDVDRWASRW